MRCGPYAVIVTMLAPISDGSGIAEAGVEGLRMENDVIDTN